MTDQPPPPPGNYPPPPPPPGGGYPPPPPPGGGGYPPPPPGGGGYPPPPPPGGGGYPPPPPGGGGYPPPPQQGGYPPPPPGAAPGYPPPQGGYPPVGGPGFGGAPAYSVGDAFSWAWGKFTNNAVPLIVATLVYGLIVVVLQFLSSMISAAVDPGESTSYVSDGSSFSFAYNISSPVGILVGIIGWFVMLIVGAAIQSAYLSGVLDIANGQQVSVGSFFKPRNIGNVVIATLIVGVITTIGFFLCIIPGLIASIMLMFTIIALLDRNLSAVDSVKASFDLAKSHFGPVILTWLVVVVTVIVGAVLCGVGLLVAVPLVALIEVYAWRKLSGAAVAELNPQPLPPGPPQAGPPPMQ